MIAGEGAYAAESGFERLPLEAEKRNTHDRRFKSIYYFNVGFQAFFKTWVNNQTQGFTACLPTE